MLIILLFSYSPLFNREIRENTRTLAMGPLCGQLALAVRNVPATRVYFSLLIANWQRYALTPLLIAIFSFFAFFGFVRGSLSQTPSITSKTAFSQRLPTKKAARTRAAHC
jgi:hypothetical protein